MQPMLRRSNLPLSLVLASTALCLTFTLTGNAIPPGVQDTAGIRTQRFDADPAWDARNNRAALHSGREVTQDFGYRKNAAKGEIGGLITPVAEPAYYAAKIPPRSFDQHLTASGRIARTTSKFHVLLGFFNAGSLGGWRTPNTVCLRLQGRGDHFYVYLEYATRKFRAGGDSPRGFTEPDPSTGQQAMRHFATGNVPHTWSLSYDPNSNGGAGSISATFDDATAVCNLTAEHRQDSATVNRFGLLNVMKSADDAGEVWLDDIKIDGRQESLARDPKWDQLNNRRHYTTRAVRPACDFGFSTTNYAGGQKAGELGGLVYRGDARYPEKMACYADRLDSLTLDKPLQASGRVSLRRAVSDSTTLIGFFHSRDTLAPMMDQSSGLPKSFLGVAVEGPSREGFLVYPTYRTRGSDWNSSYGVKPPHIYPNGASHTWSLQYTPGAAGTKGQITVQLDSSTTSIDFDPAHLQGETRFDRFGIVTTAVDGNGQIIYFDDLTYTFKQPQ